MAARDEYGAGVAEESIDSLSVAARGLGVQQDDDLRTMRPSKFSVVENARGSIAADRPSVLRLLRQNQRARRPSWTLRTKPADPFPITRFPRPQDQRPPQRLLRPFPQGRVSSWRANQRFPWRRDGRPAKAKH